MIFAHVVVVKNTKNVVDNTAPYSLNPPKLYIVIVWGDSFRMVGESAYYNLTWHKSHKTPLY